MALYGSTDTTCSPAAFVIIHCHVTYIVPSAYHQTGRRTRITEYAARLKASLRVSWWGPILRKALGL